eukprot:TRINITY_DN15962_c0_g1_i2.p1 TRINITY_DN15962_c0_g1~~TRINITY_DN15962_c0_g1_i2.p1  ORF type:complete len:174 (+),score=36.56 TRINITY_DN15962_c0_g1_i2:78-599(+)
MFPEATIYQVDYNKHIKLDHLKSLKNVTFHRLDIFNSGMKDWIKERTQGKVGFVLGIHLCGELSPRLISFFDEIEDVRALLLCPCCISKKNTVMLQTARDLSINNYDLWTMELYYTIKSDCSKRIGKDQYIDSEKNHFIGATKLKQTDTTTRTPGSPSLESAIKNKYCKYLQN